MFVQVRPCVGTFPPPPHQNTLCVNPLPQKESVLGVVHSCGGCEGPQSRTPTEALLGGLTGDPECHSQLTPGVPETSGCDHGAGELLLGCCELSHRRLDGLQGAPVASMDEAAADHALAHVERRASHLEHSALGP